MTDPARESLQAALGADYTLQRELGGGGMSRVWVARDERLGRDVVVKLLSPELAQELSVERFTREIRLAATLQHAHIVPLLSAGSTSDGLPYYLMPFVDGESLRARLVRDEAAVAMPVAETVLVLKDVARALAYAHSRGVVHRDIKPDNVMLSGGAAVVTDFGIAKAVSSARASTTPSDTATNESLTRMGTSLGTPSYMAPEQGTGDPDTDHRADIYAFGVMAYEMLSGVTPFGPRSAHALLVAHLTEAPRSIGERRSDVPPALAAFVMSCLAKDPADRPQTASDMFTALDAPPMLGSGTALGTASGMASAATTLGAPQSAAARPSASSGSVATSPRGDRRTVLVAAVAVVLLAVVGAFAWRRSNASAAAAAPSGTLLAVMPFNVRDGTLQVWREGLVDIMSRSLDGAGALRTVAASLSIAGAPERADAASASQLGQSTGAGLVLFGDLNAVGPDSVRLRAAVYDVASARVRFDIDLSGESTRMDALADSLTLRVLREIGTTDALGGSRLYSVGTRSLPALKAFLQGQQFYRRGVLDSARTAYRSALDQDSTFSLAWRGYASLYLRQGQENDPEARRALDMAIRYKSGRSPRDSMLLRGDSLRLALVRRTPGATDAIDDVPVLVPLLATLQQATRTYPGDAELWFEFGDAATHFGAFGDESPDDALATFERGIALDSTFIVSYFHALDLSLRTGKFVNASKYARRIAVLYGGPTAPYYQALAAVLDTQPLSRTALASVDSLKPPYVAGVLAQLAMTTDSGNAALQLAQRLRSEPPRLRDAADSTAMQTGMAMAFAGRGRMADAVAGGTNLLSPTLRGQLTRVGALPIDAELARARQFLQGDPAKAYPVSRLFAERGDTAALTRLLAWADGVARTPAGSQPGAPSPAILRGYRALAGGDSAGALRAFLAVPMSACGGAPCVGSSVAALLAGAGRHREAARVLDRWLPTASSSVTLPLELLARARLAERLGDDARASREYARVVALWSGGDATTRATVEEARAGLARVQRR